MNDAPWLSVVMPIFNGAATLGQSLASLEGQSDGLEIIAVDQGSTDDSRAILDDAKARLPLRIIENPNSTGWCANTNLGMREAAAPLIAMLHQDDLWEEGRAVLLRQMVKAMPEVDLWAHGGRLIDAHSRRVGRLAPPFGAAMRIVPAEEALKALLVQNTIVLPATLLRRSAALADGGLDESLWYTADWELWLRLARKGVGWHPRLAADFRVHSGSQTVRGSRDSDGFWRQLNEPPNRYLPDLPDADFARVRQMTNASNLVNLALATAYHKSSARLAQALWCILALGPTRWPAFFRNTQLVARVLPRLRLVVRRD